MIEKHGTRARSRIIWIALIIAAIGAGSVAAWWAWAARNAPWANPDDPRLVALGRTVYQARCASCHGANLEGQPNWRERRPDGRLPAPPHDASGHTWHHPDADLFDITKYGVQRFSPPGYESDMPAFEGVLSDEEIRGSLAFIKSTWPARERAMQERASGRASSQ